MRKLLFLVSCLPMMLLGQAPANYYDGTAGITGYALKSKLSEIISQKTTTLHYGDLTNLYSITDLDKYYDHDQSNTNALLDIYSEKPNGPDAYEYTVQNIISSASAEGQGWNREHMMPQSTYYGNYPMYSDMFQVIPSDARINQLRNIYPYGIANSTIHYNFSNSSKIGNSAIPNYPYTGRVYEPIDEFKGDIARSLLYFAVRYEKKLPTFKYANSTSTNITPANDQIPLDGTIERAYDQAYINMLIQWHQLDPVSQREIDRNNAVYGIQGNRNPFIDNPSWVQAIWGQASDGVAPVEATHLSAQQVSAYFVSLHWTASSSQDVIGYQIFMNGQLVGTTKATNFVVDHLDPLTTYHFTVKAYDNEYLTSNDSNIVTATTLPADSFAKDLYISKYIEGTSNNRALEITNKTGHTIDLNNYRLNIQFSSGSNFYFPAPYELEGIIENNQSFVVINPAAQLNCITMQQAKFVSAAPQMTFTGSNYIELSYKNTTVDAIGSRDQSNSSTLSNVSLYRKSNINQPNTVFSIAEWDNYPTNYCMDLGVLRIDETPPTNSSSLVVYPNPVKGGELFVKDIELKQGDFVKIIDKSGKLISSEKITSNEIAKINVETLVKGVYFVVVGDKQSKFIKD